MAILLKKLYLNREYDDVYVNIDVVNVHDGDAAEVFLSYWKDASKSEKIYGDVVSVPFDRKSDDNLYTQVYNHLKQNAGFLNSEDI